jgi:hypothetical protein
VDLGVGGCFIPGWSGPTWWYVRWSHMARYRSHPRVSPQAPLLNLLGRTKSQSAVGCELEECWPKTKEEEEMQIKHATESIKSDWDANTVRETRGYSSRWRPLPQRGPLATGMQPLCILPPPPKTTRSSSSPQWAWRGRVLTALGEKIIYLPEMLQFTLIGSMS